ncbi:hypothetical protein [Mesorhizobium escarrei]|uniref:hypothetical protein n=1 Tax=Mesorhizobium escarrei TaxID=666018 RepID=UPI0020A7C890|nr:hypothetical protein [Mesorhizobium escarrei]
MTRQRIPATPPKFPTLPNKIANRALRGGARTIEILAQLAGSFICSADAPDQGKADI